MDNLENILESILFVNGDAVDINDIVGKIDASKADIKNAVKKLKNKYKEGSGIVLLEFNNKLQFASNSAYADEVSKVLNPIRQRNLSRATLETASIIAYKQPVTRLEIEEIRGVSSDYAINILLEHNLIEIVGRKDTVGKPVLFGTTDEFLKRFNISSIGDLPDYNELIERVKVIHSDDRLYNHFEIKESDEEMEKKLGIGGENVALAKAEDTLEGEVIGENEFDKMVEELKSDILDKDAQTSPKDEEFESNAVNDDASKDDGYGVESEDDDFAADEDDDDFDKDDDDDFDDEDEDDFDDDDGDWDIV